MMRSSLIRLPWRRGAAESHPEPVQSKREPSRGRRLLNRAGTLIGVAVVLLHLFPQPLFAHQRTHGRFTVYSTRPIPPEIEPVLDRAGQLLAGTDLDDGKSRHRVFFCNSFPLFAFFAPGNRSAFASTNVIGHTYVALPEVERDRTRRRGSPHSERGLAGVLAHEATHTLIFRRIGPWRSLFQRPPPWKSEGICDLVAGEGSTPEAEGLRKMKQGKRSGSGSYAYFRYRKMVEYLTRVRGMTASAILEAPLDAGKIEAETVAWLRRGGP